MIKNQKINHNNLSYFLINILQFIDFSWVALSALIAYWLQYRNLDLEPIYAVIIPSLCLITIYWFRTAGVYFFNPNQLLLICIKNTAFNWIKLNLLLGATMLFTNTHQEISRLWIIDWFLLGIFGFIILRIIFYFIQKRYYEKSRFVTRVVVVGAEHTGRWVIQHLRSVGQKIIEVIGVYDDQISPDRPSMRPMKIQSIFIQGGINDLVNFVRNNPVDIVVVTLPYEAADRIHQAVMRLRVLPVQIHVCPGRISYELDKSEVVDLGGIPMLKILARPLEKGGWLVKQMEDLLIASMIILLISPLLLFIAIAIKLDSRGPIIYTQKRGGFNSRSFKMYKFRTMRHAPGAPLVQAQPQDPRITRVGRFLRKHSLDELPQFFNVLKRDMSIVGPRPHAIQHDQEFTAIISQYISRLRVKPGITGWAQINGFRGLTDTPEKLLKRLEYDLYYIDHWSLWFDLRIILKTILISIADKTAF